MAVVVYLGKLADTAGFSSEQLSLPSGITSAGTLRRWLDAERGFGGALLHRSIRVAVNAELVAEEHAVIDADEIAFVPPVGGG